MKSLVSLIVAALLSGCVAPADNRTLQMNQDTQIIEQTYVLCKNRVDSTPEAIRLSGYFVLGKNKNANYLQKTADESYATDQQISDIHSYHANLSICRDKAVHDLQSANMNYAKLVSDYFTKDDEITADVVNKKTTIGKANRKVTQSEYSFSLKGYDIKK